MLYGTTIELIIKISECEGGQVWNTCGSACTRTCEEPQPGELCTEQCVEQCECPPTTPIWKDGQCVPESECSTEGA